MSGHSISSSNSSLDGDGSFGRIERKPQQKGMKCLPCFTHISTGSCIYGDHCRFIHDRHLCSDRYPYTTLEQRNHVDHKIRDDPIYWPPTFNSNVSDEYTLDSKIVFHDDLRYKSIFSMWNFFLASVSDENRVWPNFSENPLTKRKRLSVFQSLADGHSINDMPHIPSDHSFLFLEKAAAKQPKFNRSIGHKQQCRYPAHNATFGDFHSKHLSRLSA